MAVGSIIFCLVTTFAPADSVMPDSTAIEEPVEFVEELQDERGGDGLIADLQWLEEHPYDLNRVTPAELLALPEVTDADVAAIVAFRKEYRRFRSVDQLSTMTGGGNRLFRALNQFVVVAGSPGDVREGVTIRSRAVRSFPETSPLLGSPVHSYSRMTLGITPGIEAGAIFEKDAGELTRDALLSGYLRARRLWGVVDALAGDFSLESGQGLVLWGGTSISKSAWSATIPRKSARGIVPSRSTDELHFLRGAALTIDLSAGLGRWEGMAFLSRRSLAASVNQEGEVTSFLTSGTFDTEALAAKRNAVHEHMAGGRIGYVYAGRASLGFTFIRSVLDRPIHRDDFSRIGGTSWHVGGIDFRLTEGGMSIFGEAARMSQGETAFVGGMSLTLDEKCSVLFLYRDYSRGFDNIHASGFGDNGDTRNERGTYTGFACDPFPWFRLRAYYDAFRHPGPTLLAPFPAEGDDLLINAEADLSRTLTITARYSVKRTESKGDGRDALNREFHPVSEKTLRRWRLGGTFHPVRRVTLRSRIEWAHADREGENGGSGVLFYQDFELRPFHVLVLSARLLFYDADVYDARMYEFESDLAGLFSSYPLDGQGRRWYAVVRLNLTDQCVLSIKYSSGEKEGGVSRQPPVTEIAPLAESRLGVQFDLRW